MLVDVPLLTSYDERVKCYDSHPNEALSYKQLKFAYKLIKNVVFGLSYNDVQVVAMLHSIKNSKRFLRLLQNMYLADYNVKMVSNGKVPVMFSENPFAEVPEQIINYNFAYDGERLTESLPDSVFDDSVFADDLE